MRLFLAAAKRTILRIIGWHEAVDLGLSVKWATCNVGAKKPEEHGDYYAWGAIKKLYYDRDTYYKYSMGHKIHVTRSKLEASSDVAQVKWGWTWRMPTYYEFYELEEYCEWQWTEMGGIHGYKVTGKNGNSIFLPAAGYCEEDNLYLWGEVGNYWSSEGDLLISSAWTLFFTNEHHYEYYERPWEGTWKGYSVRPVADDLCTFIRQLIDDMRGRQ